MKYMNFLIQIEFRPILSGCVNKSFRIEDNLYIETFLSERSLDLHCSKYIPLPMLSGTQNICG